MPTTVSFTRASSQGLTTFSELSKAGSVLLFTPVLVPASPEKDLSSKETGVDPFESFGRALSTYHKRIRHVPFLPKTGYTDTHAAFLSQSDAIIVVICESTYEKDECMRCQMDFAKRTLEAVKSKEANASNTLILIQSGSQQHRIEADTSFKNVIEIPSYDDEVAKELAQAIFKFRR